jgi:citronellyl-CoA synthetase
VLGFGHQRRSGFAIRRKFSASQFWNDVRKYRATTLGYVGELCRYLVDQPPSADDRQHGVTKMIGNGLRPGAWGEFKTRFGVSTSASCTPPVTAISVSPTF